MKKPAASNPSGSGFSASLCPASIFALFSPAIPPAGRCNLLAFTPRQRMSELTATDRCPQGNRVATICMTTTGRRAAPLGAARVKCGMSHCNILLQRARAYQPTICRRFRSSFLQNVDEQRSQRRGNQDGAIRAPPVTRLRAELDVGEKLVHAKHAERDLNDAKSKKKNKQKTVFSCQPTTDNLWMTTCCISLG